jgi:serine/threonine protein kinase
VSEASANGSAAAGEDPVERTPSGTELVTRAEARPPDPPPTDPPVTDQTVTGADRGTVGATESGSRRGLLTVGGLWGRWTLRKRIRTGGFAQVWRATDADGERAAVKFLLRPDAEVEARRFRRERDLGLGFQGKWLPRVLDSDLDDFVPWIAFEYLDFPALDQLVAASGPLTGEALVIFTRDLWDAVLSLHGHDVAHRDLSARNVLIDVDDGRLRLIDLGSGTTGDGTLLTAEVFPASMGFAAPEQFDVRGSRVGASADLWSWASVVYYAATGRTVFPVEPRMAYFEALRSGAEPDLEPVPDILRPALAAALRRDPAQRRVEEVGGLLPLRAHEEALRSAEQRLAEADAETRALRVAVAEANRRLEAQGGDSTRIDELEARAERAAADAAAARRQLEEATVATRQATAATARITELREEMERALRQREQALDASDATIKALSERLSRADQELNRLRSQVGGQGAPPAYPPPAVIRDLVRPGHVLVNPPPRPPRPTPSPPPLPPPLVAPEVPAVAPRRTRRAAKSLVIDIVMIVITWFFLQGTLAGHPALVRTLLPEPQRTANRNNAAAVISFVVFLVAFALGAGGRLLGKRRRPLPRRLWMFALPLAVLVVWFAFGDRTGAADELLRGVSRVLLP